MFSFVTIFFVNIFEVIAFCCNLKLMELRNSTSTLLQNRNIVMFAVTFAFILGVISFYNGIEIQLAITVTASMILLLYFRLVPVKFAILAVVMFYLGFFNSCLRIKSCDEVSLLAPSKVTLNGQIVSIPEITGSTGKFYLQTQGGKVLVRVKDKERNFSDLKIGNHYEIKGNLRRPGKVGNPSQFDYARYLQNHGAYSVLYANAQDCTKIQSKLSPKWIFLQRLNDLRGKILKTHSLYLKSPNLEILGGIVFGDDAVSPPEHIKESFINSGLLHILAASGMNVAFIYGFWFFFMSRLRVSYRVTLISGILVVILYTLMTGLGASVVRAALMLTFVLAGKLFDRDAHSVSLLSFVALLMLLYNPAYLNDVGFQMSFLATLGILTTGQTVYHKFKEVKLPEAVKGDVSIPVVAQAWVAPTQMFYFNTFAPYSIFANIAIIPFLCVISFGGFISSILAIFYPLTKHICHAMDFIINFFISAIVNISNFFAAIEGSIITTPKPDILQILLYYLLLGVITLLIKFGLEKKILLTGCVILGIFCATLIPLPNHNFEILAFDVQNADAFLVKTPKNDYYVIDTGKFSYGSANPQAAMTIGKYMKDNGIRKIKGLIITHFDNDHAGGGAYFIENFRVEKVYLNSTNHKTVTAASIYNALDLTGTPFEIAQNNRIIEDDGRFRITLLRSGISDNDNEDSVQTLMSYKDFDILFTGDAGVKGFEKIKEFLPADIEVLKVGHHGAKNVTSHEMLQKINPQIAIISTGQNRFGHPSKHTLENLSRYGTKVFRTDYDNAIKISTDGRKINTYTYNAEKRKFIKKNETIEKIP